MPIAISLLLSQELFVEFPCYKHGFLVKRLPQRPHHARKPCHLKRRRDVDPLVRELLRSRDGRVARRKLSKTGGFELQSADAGDG
jgi:hypothetical protein